MTPRRSATKPCNIDELPDGEVFLAGGGELNLEVTAQELTQLSMELSNAGLTEQEVSVLLSEDNYSYSFHREDSDQEIPLAGHDMDLSCIEPSISISHQSAAATAAAATAAAAASPACSHLCSEAAAAAAAAAIPASSHLCLEAAAAASPASSHLCSEAAASPAPSHLCSTPTSPHMGSPRDHRHCVTPESSPLTLVPNHTRSPQPSPRPSSRKRSAQSGGGNTPKREKKEKNLMTVKWFPPTRLIVVTRVNRSQLRQVLPPVQNLYIICRKLHQDLYLEDPPSLVRITVDYLWLYTPVCAQNVDQD